jgi:integrase
VNAQRKDAAPPGITPIPLGEFRGKVLKMYRPPKMSQRAHNAIRHALDTLARTPGVRTTADLRPEIVPRFQAAWGGAKTTTLRDAVLYLRRLCHLAIDMGHLAASPFPYDPFPKVERNPDPEPRGKVLTPEEVDRLTEYARARADNWKGSRFYAFVSTLVFTDLFKSEALYLARPDCDLRLRTIRVSNGRRAGGVVEITDPLEAVLSWWLPLAGDRFVFPNSLKRTAAWTTNHYPYGANHEIRQAGEDLNIPNLTLYFTRPRAEVLRRSGS